MKDYTQIKNYYKIAGTSVGIGIACMTIGVLLSGNGFKGLTSGGAYTNRTVEYSSKNISALVINEKQAEVQLKIGDTEQIVVHLKENSLNSYTTEVKDGVLYINKQDSKESMLFNLNLDQEKLLVEIPAKQYDSVSISNRDASVNAEDLNVKSLTIDTSNSSITLSDIEAENDITLHNSNASLNLDTVSCGGSLRAITSNSSVNAENVKANDLTFKTSNASINCKTMQAETIDLTSSNAHIEAYEISIQKGLSVVTSNGHIEGSLTGKDDYSFTCNTSNGSCRIPNSRGAKQVTLKSSNASIDFDID
ncbi:MAG: hypothetical protein EOM64_05835 [Erysipelotrichia bacterium]|nr:hypothetical protein [Erysipelotrichia bacterium]